MTAVNQKRIAKNTLMLYFRMGVIMLIGLLVARYVIKTLGEVDYGLYGGFLTQLQRWSEICG